MDDDIGRHTPIECHARVTRECRALRRFLAAILVALLLTLPAHSLRAAEVSRAGSVALAAGPPPRCAAPSPSRRPPRPRP